MFDRTMIVWAIRHSFAFDMLHRVFLISQILFYAMPICFVLTVIGVIQMENPFSNLFRETKNAIQDAWRYGSL